MSAVRKNLYPRLALSNLRKHRKLNLPFLLAAACAVMMFYILLALHWDPAILRMDYGYDVCVMMTLGCVVIGVFSLLLLFYTSSLLMKQRRREFGLYNVLGMEKRHIARLLLWETLFMALAAIGAGILCGVLFSKLMQLLLLRLIGLHADFSFGVDFRAIGLTAALYGVFFLLIALNTVGAVYRAKPVELLRGTNEGEREPKTRWLAAVLGVLCLGAGYGLALNVDSVIGAATWFFVAVLLVIAGTYLCFTAFSIVLLKALRRNKRYYYKTSHFTTVSGMLYRMKRNAAGLASICILSTMVLVTVSTTVCLYLGIHQWAERNYGSDFSAMTGGSREERDREAALIERLAREAAEKNGITLTDWTCIEELDTPSLLENGELRFEKQADGLNPSYYEGTPDPRAVMLRIYTAEGYTQLTGKPLNLGADELLWSSTEKDLGGAVTLLGRTYRLTQVKEDLSAGERGRFDLPLLYLVVDSRETLEQIAAAESAAYYNSGQLIQTTIRFNVESETLDRADALKVIHEAVREPESGYRMLQNNTEMRDNLYAAYGAFLFLGIFLGLIFALATVLIIYYKQISEGYDDRARYDIMQKVGLTRAEIRKTVRSQVLTVFFLPLATAAVHVACAFPMIEKILKVFSMTDTALFARCTLAAFGCFAALYIVVYLLTARAYYGIVSTAE